MKRRAQLAVDHGPKNRSSKPRTSVVNDDDKIHSTFLVGCTVRRLYRLRERVGFSKGISSEILRGRIKY